LRIGEDTRRAATYLKNKKVFTNQEGIGGATAHEKQEEREEEIGKTGRDWDGNRLEQVQRARIDQSGKKMVEEREDIGCVRLESAK
jgi:hypothetical protein